MPLRLRFLVLETQHAASLLFFFFRLPISYSPLLHSVAAGRLVPFSPLPLVSPYLTFPQSKPNRSEEDLLG